MTDTTTPAPAPEVGYTTTQDAAQALMARWNARAEQPTGQDSESEAPATEEPEEPASEQAAEATADDASAPDGESEVDIELDVGGDKLKLPGRLKEQAEHIQRKVKELEAGSTRKFQEAAELRKQVEAEREQVQQLQKLAAQHTDLIADYRATQREIESLNALDWNALSDSDPVQAQKAMARLMTLQNAQQRIGAQLAQAGSQMQAREQELRAQQIQRGNEQLSKLVPNLTDAVKADLAKYIGTRSLTPEGKQALYDPEVVAAFHDAWKYRQMQEAKPAITKRAVEAPKTLKPGTAAAPATSAQKRYEDAKKRAFKSGSNEDIAAALLARSMFRK